MNGNIYASVDTIAGYPYSINYKLEAIKTGKKATLNFEGRGLLQELLVVPPGNYKVTFSRNDKSSSPSIRKNVKVNSGDTTSVVFGKLPRTIATVELNLKVLPKGQDVKGLRLNMLTPWNSTTTENDFRWFGVTPLTKKQNGFYVSSTRFLQSPAGQYQITEAFPSSLNTTISSPAGVAVHNKVSKTNLITVNVGKYRTSFYFYITQADINQSFIRTTIKCTGGGKTFTKTAGGVGYMIFDLPAGTYEVSYNQNWGDLEHPAWVKIEDVTVAKNQVVLKNYIQSTPGHVYSNFVVSEMYWLDKF